MTPRLKKFLDGYAALERRVQELVRAQCQEICRYCAVRCCRADICEEALHSPFLRALHQRSELETDRYGFLTECGCALDLGRPPVCYEFFCEEILNAQPDELHRKVLTVLGRLPGCAGELVPGETHLSEIRQPEQLEKLDLQTLENQLRQCFQTLDLIETFYAEGSLPEESRKVLELIRVPSED